MRHFTPNDEPPRIVLKWRDGRWVATLRKTHRSWKIAAECVAMIVLSCGVVALGGMASFYANQARFDADGQRFAEDSLNLVMRSWSVEALMARASPELIANRSDDVPAYFQALQKLGPGQPDKGCFGRAHLELFNPTGLVFGSYTCEIRIRNTLAVADMRLRRDPDDWKIIAFYVSTPTTTHP